MLHRRLRLMLHSRFDLHRSRLALTHHARLVLITTRFALTHHVRLALRHPRLLHALLRYPLLLHAFLLEALRLHAFLLLHPFLLEVLLHALLLGRRLPLRTARRTFPLRGLPFRAFDASRA